MRSFIRNGLDRLYRKLDWLLLDDPSPLPASLLPSETDTIPAAAQEKNPLKVPQEAQEYLSVVPQHPLVTDVTVHLHRIVLMLIVLASLWIGWPFLNDGLPVSWDGTSHFVRLKFVEQELLPSLRLDGWFPYWYNGLQLFLFYHPMFYLITVALHGIMLGIPSLLSVYKVMTLFIYMLMPISLYIMMRLFDVNRWAAVAAAAFSLNISTIHGIGIEGIFTIGIVTHCFAIAILPLAIASWHKGVLHGRKWLLLGGLMIAFMLQTHFIVPLYLGIELLLYIALVLIAAQRSQTLVLFRVSLMGLIVLSLTAYWLYPFVRYQDMVGPQTGFPAPDIGIYIKQYWQGDFLGSRWTNRLALVGLIGCLLKRSFAAYFFALSALLSGLLAFAVLDFTHPTLRRLFSEILINRSFSFLGLWDAVLAGMGLNAIIQMILKMGSRIHKNWLNCPQAKTRFRVEPTNWQVENRTALKWLNRPVLLTEPIGKLLCMGLLAYLSLDVVSRVLLLRPIIQTEKHFESSVERRAYFEAFDWLQSHAKPDALLAMDARLKDFGNPGFNDVFSHIVFKTWKPTLGGLQIESTKSSMNVDPMYHLHDWPPEQIQARFVRYNVGYVVVYNIDAIQNLEKSPLFEKVYESGRVVIFQVKKMPNQMATSTTADIILKERQREKLEWEVTSHAPEAPVVLAVSHHPYWKGFLNSKPIPIVKTDDNLMSVQIPDAGKASLQLVFTRSLVVDILAGLSFVLQFGLWILMLLPERMFSDKIKWMDIL